MAIGNVSLMLNKLSIFIHYIFARVVKNHDYFYNKIKEIFFFMINKINESQIHKND